MAKFQLRGTYTSTMVIMDNSPEYDNMAQGFSLAYDRQDSSAHVIFWVRAKTTQHLTAAETTRHHQLCTNDNSSPNGFLYFSPNISSCHFANISASTQTAAIGCRGDILMNLFKFNRKYGERGIFCRNIIKVAYQGAYLHRGGYDKSALLPHAQLCRKLELLKKIEQGIIFRLV